jgi:hypothetical protein
MKIEMLVICSYGLLHWLRRTLLFHRQICRSLLLEAARWPIDQSGNCGPNFGRAPKFNLRLNLLNTTWQLQSKVAKSPVLWWVASASLVYVSSFRARKVLKLWCWCGKIMFFPLGICFFCRLLGCHRPSCLRPAVQTHRSLKPPDGKHGARVSMAILILF